MERRAVVDGWGRQVLWKACVFGVWCGARVENDLAKIQSSWPELIIRKEDTCLYE